MPFTFSCYLIKHGDEYMVWDTGFAPGSNPNAPKVSLTEQLAQLKIKPEQVKYVGISHFHADHTSQLPSLPDATLLIGQREWEALTAPKPMARRERRGVHSTGSAAAARSSRSPRTRTCSATARS